jgi:hypothetical protein
LGYSRVSIDISGWLRKRQMVQKQARFATAVALTQTAKDAQKALTQALPQIFDRPIAFTQNSVTIISATKAKLESVVLVKDKQATYLAIQEVGGTQRPRPGAPLVVPVNIRRNVYGNIGRGGIKREVAKPGVFTVGRNAQSNLPPGIYRRGKGRNRTAAPVLLVSLERRTQYKPRFNMKRRVLAVAEIRFPINFERALRHALATAR